MMHSAISSHKILFDNFRLELILVLSFKLSTLVHSRTKTHYYFQIIINNLDIFVFQIACEKKSIPSSLEFEESDFIAPLESDESPDLDEFRYRGSLPYADFGTWKNVLQEIGVSGTVGGPLLMQKSATFAYISQKLW